MSLRDDNHYLPVRAIIKGITEMCPDVRLFRVSPGVRCVPGQFFMVSVWGAGEVPISVASAGDTEGSLEFCIRRVGSVTSAIHRLRKGDVVWLRGPYGNGFPIGVAEGRDVIFVAGGMGIVPLRPLIALMLMERERFGRLFLVYGSKSPGEVLFSRDLRAWRKEGVRLILTVDRADSTWKGGVGLVTDHLEAVDTDLKEACSFICGPPVMIEVAMRRLSEMGMAEGRIITSLEARMKCGMGKCGQCYAGGKYICRDGPVFTYGAIKAERVYGP